jgi:hypothetical protein
MAIDPQKLEAFVGRFVQDLGAVIHAATVLLGDRLGLYKAMADGSPVTPEELARRTSTDARYVREWLSAQAASGYVEYDSAARTFRLPEEQAFALTRSSPIFTRIAVPRRRSGQAPILGHSKRARCRLA